MSTERIRVKVTIDTDELREWADRHADAGNHGVAHVLYKAASEGESLGEQALREVRADAWDEGSVAFARSFLKPLGENGMRDMEPNPYRTDPRRTEAAETPGSTDEQD